MKECQKKLPQAVQLNKTHIDFFPAKCKMYLQLLISIKQEKTYSQIPKAIRKNYQYFTSIFKKLEDIQRTYFIAKNIEFARQKLNGCVAITPPNIYEIETTCDVKTSFMKMVFWQKRTIKYEYNYQRVKFCTSKKQDIIDLKSYLVRRSSSQKYGLVLESFDPIISQKFQKISFKFSNSSICEEILYCLRESIIEISFKRIQCLLGDDSRQQKDVKIAEQKETMDLTILTNKNLSSFFEEKEDLVDKLKKGRRQVFGIYSEANLMILNSAQSSKYYYLEYVLPPSWNNLAIIRENIKILGYVTSSQFTCEILQRFNASISANYYKIHSQNEEFEMIMLVEQIEKGGQLQQLMKSTSNIFFGANVPFMEIIVKKKKQGQYALTISAISRKSHHKKTPQNQRIIIKFLKSLIRPSFEGSNASNISNKLDIDINSFSPTKKSSFDAASNCNSHARSKSVNPNFRSLTYNNKQESPTNNIVLEIPCERNISEQEDDAEDETFYSIEDVNEDIEQLEEIQEIYHTISAKIVQNYQQVHHEGPLQITKPPINYLNTKYPNEPCQKYPANLITEKEHNLLVDWKKLAKGGVICINKEAIQQQKRVIKLAFNQIGSKVFKMKGIINFSLPIQICRGESALISLARNISYAPLLLEKTSSMTALERMKQIITLHVSWSSLALSTQKPFNPILGETYQGFLNGCPLYMEQVSHHPAISYLYFVGRGYKIYGQIAPIVYVRLNYLNAAMQELITIQFDNGDKCQFSISTMVINGIIFGERSIYFDGVCHVIDKKNNMIAEIRYNAKNNSLFKSKENPDSFMGEIYQVTQAFINKFMASGRKTSLKKDDKNRLIGSISGEWDGVLMFNGQKFFDFEHQLPVKLENSESPLASDGVFREDIICKVLGDVVKGQEQKEKLEEIQRRDKKLRNKHKQSGK